MRNVYAELKQNNYCRIKAMYIILSVEKNVYAELKQNNFCRIKATNRILSGEKNVCAELNKTKQLLQDKGNEQNPLS